MQINFTDGTSKRKMRRILRKLARKFRKLARQHKITVINLDDYNVIGSEIDPKYIPEKYKGE